MLPIDKIGIQANSVTVRVLYEGGYYMTSETYAEIAEKIEAATEKSEPRQNIYYRTLDRLPTAEDADRDGCVFVSESCDSFCRTDTENAKMWTFWAPCPKVEVRG